MNAIASMLPKADSSIEVVRYDKPCATPDCGAIITHALKGQTGLKCTACESREEAINQQKALRQSKADTVIEDSILSGKYSGITWESMAGDNEQKIHRIRQLMNPRTKDGPEKFILIGGMANGTRKTTTSKLIQRDWIRAGRSVKIVLLIELQNELGDMNTRHHVIEDYKSVGLLIIDEIAKGAESKTSDYYQNLIMPIFIRRCECDKPTMLIGNIAGPIGTDKRHSYASDNFKASLIQEFNAFEFIGKDFRKK